MFELWAANASLSRPAVGPPTLKAKIMFSETNDLEFRTYPQGRFEVLVYARHGHELMR